MAKLAFTELTIRNLKPGSYFDEKTPAFGIRVGKNRKTWIVVRGRERLRTRVGHYPALPLAEARKKALVLLGSPLDTQSLSTFADARELFLRTHCAQHQRERTRRETERLLTKHFASLGPDAVLMDLGLGFLLTGDVTPLAAVNEVQCLVELSGGQDHRNYRLEAKRPVVPEPFAVAVHKHSPLQRMGETPRDQPLFSLVLFVGLAPARSILVVNQRARAIERSPRVPVQVVPVRQLPPRGYAAVDMVSDRRSAAFSL